MIHLVGRTSLLVAFSLLTSVGTVSAECAWVLWGDVVGQTWIINSVYESHRECKKALKTLLRPTPLGVPELRDGPFSDKALFVHKARCLPDNVDPRGPKGGGR